MFFESSICVQRDGKAKGKPKEVDNTLYSCGGGECHHGLGQASLTLTKMTHNNTWIYVSSPTHTLYDLIDGGEHQCDMPSGVHLIQVEAPQPRPAIRGDDNGWMVVSNSDKRR